MTDGEMSKEAKNKEIDDLLASSEEEEEEQADAGAQPGKASAGDEGANAEAGEAGEATAEPEPETRTERAEGGLGRADALALKKRKAVEQVPGADLEPYVFAEPPFFQGSDPQGKKFVCCKQCRLVKTYAQFYELGCENCPGLGMRGERERIFGCTTNKFDGLIAIVKPNKSWAFKFLRLGKRSLPGCYAMRCEEKIDQGILEEIRDRSRY